jgi:PTH1 family peptidyl-tRNA hydrolase
MKMIVGLGNPSSCYSSNRHNIGSICLRYIARKHTIRFDKKQSMARTGRGIISGSRVLLARPQLYMNLSGQSVKLLVDRFRVKPTDLIVIHDDLDLPIGIIRLRKGGGSGGHKGLDSIIYEIGNFNFIRIRFGIGRPEGEFSSIDEKNKVVSAYVLSDFSKEERMAIKPSIALVSDAVNLLLEAGLEAAMARFN